MGNLILAILPVVFQFIFEEVKSFFKRKAPTKQIRAEFGEFKNAIKDKDIERINYLYNSVFVRNRIPSKGSDKAD